MNNLKSLQAKFPEIPKFKNIEMSLLGIGTIWFGRRWPMNNIEYSSPFDLEINEFLSFAMESGITMIDTAAAYGYSEERIGKFFVQNPSLLSKVFIATKWGEEFDLEKEQSSYNTSIEHFRFSLQRSLQHLPKIDLIYMHKANVSVLADEKLREAIQEECKKNSIPFIGVSVSDIELLKEFLEKGLLWPDFVQTDSSVFWQEPELIKKIFELGKAIVINSPVRSRPSGIQEEEVFYQLSSSPFVSIVLTGTRHHLRKTMSYFVER